MSPRPFLSAVALTAAMLAGCPQTTVQSGPSSLKLTALAVTAKAGTSTSWIPNIHLTWNAVPGADSYELNLQGVSTALQKNRETEYKHTPNDGVVAGDKYTYTVRALDAKGTQLITSAPVGVTVLKHAVLSPDAITVTPSDGSSTTPTISWNQVTGAAGYYVTVSVSNSDTVTYAALTEEQSVQVGKLPLEEITLKTLDQKGEGVVLTSKTYDFSVQALASEKSLKETTAVDVSTASVLSMRIQ